MKSRDFKIRFWIPFERKMIYFDKLRTSYEYNCTINMFGISIYHGEESFYNYVDSVPMLALPTFDITGRQIYDFDILECNYSDYYATVLGTETDPYGTHYPSDKMIHFIADYRSEDIPSDVKIVGNKFENPDLYRQTLWDLDLKSRWNNLEIQTNNVMKKYPTLRHGQALFITFWNNTSLDTKLIEKEITATIYDPFNDDSNIDKFKEKVIDLWIEEWENE